MTSVVAQLVARRPAQAFLTVSRPLSTSRIVRNDFETNNFSRPAPVNKDATDTLYIGNLPFSVQEQDIREKFEVYGPIHSLRLGEYHHLLVCISSSLMWKFSAYKPDGSARGFAHIQFASKADAIAAVDSINEEPMYIMDRDIRVDFAPVRTPVAPEPYHKLFFQNFEGDEIMLRDAAQEFESSIISVFFCKRLSL